MDRRASTHIFAAFAPAARLVFGYVWKRADFPWMGIWEENHSRTQRAVEWQDADARHGIRRVADAGIAAADDGSRQTFWRAGVSMASR